MTLTVSIAEMREDIAYEREQIVELRRVLPDVGERDRVPIAVWWALPSTRVHDRWWILGMVVDGQVEALQIAVRAAALAVRRRLPPRDDASREAFEAVDVWLADPTNEDLIESAHFAAYRARAVDEPARRAAGDVALAVGAYAVCFAARAASEAVEAAAGVPTVGRWIEIEAQRADLDRLLAEVTT